MYFLLFCLPYNSIKFEAMIPDLLIIHGSTFKCIVGPSSSQKGSESREVLTILSCLLSATHHCHPFWKHLFPFFFLYSFFRGIQQSSFTGIWRSEEEDLILLVSSYRQSGQGEDRRTTG